GDAALQFAAQVNDPAPARIIGGQRFNFDFEAGDILDIFIVTQTALDFAFGGENFVRNSGGARRIGEGGGGAVRQQQRRDEILIRKIQTGERGDGAALRWRREAIGREQLEGG